MVSGDPPNTARKPRPKPTGKKANKLSQEEQSARFIKTAREIGVDESGEAFEKAVRGLLRPKERRP